MNTSVNTLPISVRSENMIAGCGTYFRTSDVTPYVESGELVIANGIGCSRSWGKAQVRSRVVRLADNIVAVEVEGWHKHSRKCHGPTGGTFYFVNESGEWIRRTANYKAVKAALNS